MIYFCISEAEKDAANQWIKTNCDLSGGVKTFSVNRKDPDSGEGYCLISIVDNTSAYATKMKAHFGYTDFIPGLYNSRKVKEENKVESGKIANAKQIAKSADNSSFIKSMKEL